MELNIRNIGFIEKEVHYHAVYRSRYKRQAESSAATEDHNLGLDTDVLPTDWHRSREVHADAFAIVCDFIEESILNKKEVHMMKDLNKIYHSALYDIPPYRKKPKLITSDFLSLDHSSRKYVTHTFETAKIAGVL